jgi:predicted SAM-dependent methyltransferase
MREDDRSVVGAYFRDNQIRKLHIGCGSNVLDTWLNSDFSPQTPGIVHLDATQRFPFEDCQFDFVFSEHMIEHISFSQGLVMLSECYRVLKERGKIRISTPDLCFLLELYKADKSDFQKEYIRWSTETFIPDAPYDDAIFVINNFVRDWGHLFIYDENTMQYALRKARFSQITRCPLNASDDEVLRNLENEERLPPGFLRLETMTFEGTKA